jgi:hypothetical protein
MQLDLANLEDLKARGSIEALNQYLQIYINHISFGGAVQLIRVDDVTMETFVYSVIHNIHDFMVFVRLFFPQD